MYCQRLLLASVAAGLLCAACTSPRTAAHYGPRGFWKPNRYDRNGLAKGRWRTYYDSAKQEPFTAGRYRHGRPVRTFQYYAPGRVLDRSVVAARPSAQGRCSL